MRLDVVADHLHPAAIGSPAEPRDQKRILGFVAGADQLEYRGPLGVRHVVESVGHDNP